MATSRHKSILVVDDDPAMVRALDRVLQQAGYAVHTAQSGDEAMERLTSLARSLDLVISDIRMPMINGGMVLNTIKAVFPALPVIIITAYAGPSTREEFLAGGAAGFLEKPVSTRRLLAEVSRVLTGGEDQEGGYEADR